MYWKCHLNFVGRKPFSLSDFCTIHLFHSGTKIFMIRFNDCWWFLILKNNVQKESNLIFIVIIFIIYAFTNTGIYRWVQMIFVKLNRKRNSTKLICEPSSNISHFEGQSENYPKIFPSQSLNLFILNFLP